MKPGFLFTFLLAGSTIVHASSQTSITLGNKLRNKRSEGDFDEKLKTICERFENPLPNNTFFSPIDTTMLSDTYPPKVDCTLHLTAPPGFQIRLDFRNRFYIEPSATCEYDYLEIRDGKYGFSYAKEPFGKYCGQKFPDEIFSSDRYLWLRFHSDDNIEYDGFEGVFEYVERPKNTEAIEECYFKPENQTAGKISHKDINETYIERVKMAKLKLDCLWTIEVKPGWGIMLSVEKFDLDKKNDCDSNFVDIIGNDTNVSQPKKHFCGVVAESDEIKSSILYVRFFATDAGMGSKFTLLYTAYRKKDSNNGTSQCTADEFDCDDDSCIDSSLQCDGYSNCKFKKDEQGCVKAEGETKDLWVIIAVFSALLGAMTSVFLFNCIRTLIRDQKIIRETIRQSKESKLDEAGRMSIKRSLENVNRIIPGSTGYAIEPRLKQIQDEDAGHIFREATSASSISDSVNRINKNQYNYRDELKKIYRNPPPEAFNNNEHAEQYANEGVCDMACQTGSSLSGSGISGTTKLPPAHTQPPGTYKFSTFGYNPLDDDIGVQEIPMQSTYDRHRIASITPNRYDATSPGVVYTYEHPCKYEMPLPAPSSATTNLRTFTGTGRNVKMEQSQLMLEIRNSAPDVIIMTSH